MFCLTPSFYILIFITVLQLIGFIVFNMYSGLIYGSLFVVCEVKFKVDNTYKKKKSQLHLYKVSYNII